MDLPVQNITDLQKEILRLEALRQQQKIDLKHRFNSPSAIFSTAKTLFPRNAEHTNKNNLFSQDILGLISRVVLPFTLNKTLFKNSNFLVKTLIGMLSQKASTYINEDAVTGVWGKMKHLFSKTQDQLGKAQDKLKARVASTPKPVVTAKPVILPKTTVVEVPPVGIPSVVDMEDSPINFKPVGKPGSNL